MHPDTVKFPVTKSACLKRESRRTFLIVLLVFSAFFRWLPGGNPLDPTTGVRALVEIGLLGVVEVLSFFWWAKRLWSALLNGWWLLLPSGWAVLTSLWSPSPSLTFVKATELFAITLLAGAIWRGSLTFLDWLRVVQWALMFLVLLGIGLNVVYYNTPFYYGLPPGDDSAMGPTRVRFTLAAEHPLVVGHLFALLLLVSLALMVRSLRLSSAILVAISLWGLLATQARASLAMTIAALLWGFERSYRRRLGRIGGLLEIVLFLIVAFLMPTLVSETLETASVYAPDVDTLNGRIPLWESVLETLLSDSTLLLLGTGFEATRFLTYDLAYWNPGHTHNGFLEILAGTGVIGLAFYFPTMLFLVRASLNPLSASLSFYFMGIAFFNPVFRPEILWFVVLTTLLLAQKEQQRVV
ncbi:O-antigen ligase [Brockia lithotrophica]|uniref:O-antigen ligase n=2 Tax=Brockia lithotrophica TaxID=933949 RepID=A0A660LA60_9BACL|nr:O-antigen ligase [Brockia lithotrophica]